MTTVNTFVSRLRDDLAERRMRTIERRELQRELASYTSPAHIDDLLAALEGQDTPIAEEMRTLLLRNLNAASNSHFAA